MEEAKLLPRNTALDKILRVAAPQKLFTRNGLEVKSTSRNFNSRLQYYCFPISASHPDPSCKEYCIIVSKRRSQYRFVYSPPASIGSCNPKIFKEEKLKLDRTRLN